MSKKSEERAALLNALAEERDRLEAEIETMIADMAGQPEAARKTGDWAADGASTRRYLEITERLSDVEQEIVDLARTMAASADEAKPH